ncbi:putative 2-aminoethylphosphonate ABC transporter substrate-binding protein [Salinispirillum sp. LH 10-3-1]
MLSLRSLSQLAVAALASTSLLASAAELTVYTAIESDDLAKYAARFNEAHPDIKINWVRDSTGVITARLLAEKNNPRADVIWGLAGTSLMLLLQEEGMLHPYSPANIEQLSPAFRDNSNPAHWVGMDAWMAAICFNTIEAARHNLPQPTSWQDLTNPVYRGHIVMPNPASSGTGYLDVSSWLQIFGEEGGWEYMDGLHANMKNYTHSGSRPCVDAATGETAIGISFAFRGAREKQRGAPIELVFPTEGTGWDMEATAIVKGTKNLDAAQTLVDWSISRAAMEMYNEGYAIVAMPGVAQPVQYFPANAEELLIDNDFVFAATQRERILREWERRYDGKSDAR